MTSRRSFCQSLLLFSLASGFQANKLFAAENASDEIQKWIAEVNALGCRLADHEISQIEWQQGMDLLYSRVDIPQLVKAIDFDALTKQVKYQGKLGEAFLQIPVPGVDERVDVKLAAVKKGRAIVPHGHANMVSAFLTLSGEFHVRMYDRLALEEDALVIRQTVDARQKPGEWSNISDQHNNVHWLQAKADDTYLLSIKLVNLVEGAYSAGRIPIDPFGESVGRGIVRAKRISHFEANERFG